eukprot:m.236700 g.236700  ORF g.236700 m.236700 type:complete len:680 (+) comp16053_c1_seq4:266-2305(+)
MDLENDDYKALEVSSEMFEKAPEGYLDIEEENRCSDDEIDLDDFYDETEQQKQTKPPINPLDALSKAMNTSTDDPNKLFKGVGVVGMNVAAADMILKNTKKAGTYLFHQSSQEGLMLSYLNKKRRSSHLNIETCDTGVYLKDESRFVFPTLLDLRDALTQGSLKKDCKLIQEIDLGQTDATSFMRGRKKSHAELYQERKRSSIEGANDGNTPSPNQAQTKKGGRNQSEHRKSSIENPRELHNNGIPPSPTLSKSKKKGKEKEKAPEPLAPFNIYDPVEDNPGVKQAKVVTINKSTVAGAHLREARRQHVVITKPEEFGFSLDDIVENDDKSRTLEASKEGIETKDMRIETKEIQQETKEQPKETETESNVKNEPPGRQDSCEEEIIVDENPIYADLFDEKTQKIPDLIDPAYKSVLTEKPNDDMNEETKDNIYVEPKENDPGYESVLTEKPLQRGDYTSWHGVSGAGKVADPKLNEDTLDGFVHDTENDNIHRYGNIAKPLEVRKSGRKYAEVKEDEEEVEDDDQYEEFDEGGVKLERRKSKILIADEEKGDESDDSDGDYIQGPMPDLDEQALCELAEKNKLTHINDASTGVPEHQKPLPPIPPPPPPRSIYSDPMSPPPVPDRPSQKELQILPGMKLHNQATASSARSRPPVMDPNAPAPPPRRIYQDMTFGDSSET